MKYLTFAAATLCTTAALAETPVLTVYAGDYFTSEWGPGPVIEAGFEEFCDCDLQFATGDLLPRLLLEGTRTKADVVIGLTSDVTAKARATGLFAPHGQDNDALTLPIAWSDDTFLPFNYGHTAFIYNETRMDTPPASFADLLEMPDDVKIVIQDPRTSISGLALVLWVEAIYGDEAKATWEKLAPKILTVTKDWSSSYGMFTDGEADMVLSYTTSPAYHMFAEEDFTKKAAIFPEGHYFMVETVAKIAQTEQPELADAFMAYVMSENFQTVIPTANWSLPSALPQDQWPEGWNELPLPEKVLFYDETQAAALQEKAIEAWRSALTQ
ncbi:thiamine ABC transporter substrate-binding protein [Sulfitobacter sp. SK012]|uniref:thiamine ABC transporter substrate-binding protein n=1 Tax=Sulfitobacter sp. SK012 TaxID=1389005 RepID=UPI000E0C774E|nr:thiamine ABC transporter substrate-binding protein [Sulfitobacter sp. SK012]AXI48425.1 thiamine ABC transporter substrate-binding protein [Sulfitobacter sp. SK012]